MQPALGAGVVVLAGGDFRAADQCALGRGQALAGARVAGTQSQRLAEPRERAALAGLADAAGIQFAFAQAIGLLRLVDALQPVQVRHHGLVVGRDRPRHRRHLVRAAQRQRIVVDRGQRLVALASKAAQRGGEAFG